MSHIFISYAHADKSFVHRLSEDLLDRGLPVWIDNISLVGGMKWETEIEHNIGDASCVLVVVSPNAAASTWVEQEIQAALDHNKPLIPILTGSGLEAMPEDLKQHQGYDFTGHYPNALRNLLANPHFPLATRKQFDLSDVLRDGTMTFDSLAKQWRSTISFGRGADSPVGLLLERSKFGSKAYLVGPRSAHIKVPNSVQVFLQFSGAVEEPAFDQFLAFIREQSMPLWTILVRGPMNEINGRYELPDNDPDYWADAIKLAWDSIDRGMFTAGHAAFFAFAPNTLALGIGAAKHFKFPIDIYNLNRVQPTDKNRYFRVCSVTPPR